MTVSPSDLLSLAKDLNARATKEVEFRNVVGRAYYAAYHKARAFHDTLPVAGRTPSKPTGVHEELAFRLSWPKVPETDPRFIQSRDLGKALRWLHSKRVKADYFLDDPVSPDEARDVLNRAEGVLAL